MKTNPAEVWSTRFWMGVFKSLSPKPHVVYSNDEHMVLMLSTKAGHMTRQQQLEDCPVRTARTYIDKRGVKRSVGRKAELKESQSLGAWNQIHAF